jgi:hypothetical protein
MTTKFTTEEIQIAKDHLSEAAICLMEHGFNPMTEAEEIEKAAWQISNAFLLGYIEQDDEEAQMLLVKLEETA